MAQEITTVPSTDPARSGDDSEISKTLANFLRGYNPARQNEEYDILGGRYQIDLNSPLPDFNCKTAIAYSASDIKNPEKAYVALICGVGTIQRTHLIHPLINFPHPQIMALVSAGVVSLSRPQEERFVIIYERPKGEKISRLIAATKHRPSFDFICNYIIAPIATAIQHLSDLGITHGNINCENIYFDTASTVGAVIGPCVAEPCGLSQIFYYEPVERMQAMPAGKGEGDSAQDYYALAVVVLNIIYGVHHFDNLSEDELIRGILKEGAFNALTRQKDMPEIFYDFFRGLLSYNSQDRWNYRYLRAWLNGKRYNVMPTPPPQEAIRPFEFNDGLAYTRKEVAYLFYHNWDLVPEVFANGQLSTWVAISLRNKELNEYLLRTAKVMNSPGRKNDTYINEQIMRAIIMFDPSGPVRLKKLSFHLDGINSLFVDLVLTNAEAELQLLMQFIELSMFHFVIEQKSKELEKREETESSTTDAMFMRMDRLRGIIRNNGLGFGIERILYDLNPGFQCLSPLLAGTHVASLSALLRTLDQLAPSLSRDKDPIDRHIAAFIASHLGIQHEIFLTSLTAQPLLAKSHALIALRLLASAQQRSKIAYLPGLTNWLALRILPLLDVIRSRTLKRKLTAMLASAARSGSTQKMSELLIESGYAQAEASAFQQAVRNFKQNANDIVYYSKAEMIDIHSKRLGARMAHYVAIAALVVSFALAVAGG